MPGAVLNKKNKGRISSAMELIKAVLVTAGVEDDSEDTAQATPQAPTAPATPKATAVAAKEAAGFSMADLGNALNMAVRDLYPEVADYDGYKSPRIEDVFDADLVYREGYAGPCYRVTYTITENGAVSLGMPELVVRKVTYVAPGSTAMNEAHGGDVASALESDLLPLTESAIKQDGTADIKIIAPGWGSTGYYPADVLKRDGPNVFKAGTKMFWNHATMREEAERPEGDLDRHAATLVEDARWVPNHPKGAGLYAKAQVYAEYAGRIDERARHIGVSIRGDGSAKIGEAEGRKGPIITAIKNARSVDFVTAAGAGGMVLTEAARPPQIKVENDMERGEIEALITEAIKPVAEQNAHLRETLNKAQALNVVNAELLRYEGRIPARVSARVREITSDYVPMTESGALDAPRITERVHATVRSELTYLGLGGVDLPQGDGGTAPQGDSVNLGEALTPIFQGWGLSESAAKRAAEGR